MSEEKNVMQDALVSIIQQTQKGIDASVSFLSEQIPDVVQQLLVWKFAQSIVIALLMFSFVFTYLKLFKFVWNYTSKHFDGYDRGPARGFYGFLGGFAAMLCFGVGVENSMNALQIYIAPKVYLIEYAASLVK